MQRVLDTAALLHWPMNQLAGGICAESQRRELSQLSEARSMLIDAADRQWQDAPQIGLNEPNRLHLKAVTCPDFQMLMWTCWLWHWVTKLTLSPMIIVCKMPTGVLVER